MKPQIAEIPKHPLRQNPQPQTPQQPPVQEPSIFVYERQQWEYRVLTQNTADEPNLSEDELTRSERTVGS